MLAEGWIIIKPMFGTAVAGNNRPVRKLSIGNQVYVKKPPRSTVKDGIAVRLTIDIDSDAFQPIEPEVKVHVPVQINEDIDIVAEPVVINRKGRALNR